MRYDAHPDRPVLGSAVAPELRRRMNEESVDTRLDQAAPQIRRVQAKTFVRTLRGRDDYPELEARVVNNVDLAALTEGLNIGWAPLRPYCDLLELVEDAFGQEAFVEFWQDTFSALMEQRFLANFTDLLKPLSASSISPVARRAPLVYRHVSRGCGQLSWASDADGGLLELRDFPSAYPLRLWSLSMLGCLRATASILDFDRDVVELDPVRPSDRRAVFRVLGGA